MPGNWEVLDRLIRLLAITGRFDEAESTLADAVATDQLGFYRDKADDLVEAVEAARRGEAIQSWSPKKNRRFGFSETPN